MGSGLRRRASRGLLVFAEVLVFATACVSSLPRVRDLDANREEDGFGDTCKHRNPAGWQSKTITENWAICVVNCGSSGFSGSGKDSRRHAREWHVDRKLVGPARAESNGQFASGQADRIPGLFGPDGSCYFSGGPIPGTPVPQVARTTFPHTAAVYLVSCERPPGREPKRDSPKAQHQLEQPAIDPAPPAPPFAARLVGLLRSDCGDRSGHQRLQQYGLASR